MSRFILNWIFIMRGAAPAPDVEGGVFRMWMLGLRGWWGGMRCGRCRGRGMRVRGISVFQGEEIKGFLKAVVGQLPSVLGRVGMAVVGFCGWLGRQCLHCCGFPGEYDQMRIIRSSSSKHTTYHLPLLVTRKRCPHHHRRIYRSASFDPEA